MSPLVGSMATEAEEAAVERCEVKEGEVVTREDSRWGSFALEVGDLLEVRVAPEKEGDPETRVALLVTGVKEKDLVEGRYLGSSNEEVAKHCVNKINRKGLPIHLCREDPCEHRIPEVAIHVNRLSWWRPEKFPGQDLRNWGTQVLKEWMETGTIKRRKKGDETGDPTAEPAKKKGPGKGVKPPFRARRKGSLPPKGTRRLVGKGKGLGDRGGGPDKSKLGQLRDRLAGLREKLRVPGKPEEQEVIDVEDWSDGQQDGGDYDYAEDRVAELGSPFGHMDPFTSHLALAPAVKQEAIKDGTLRERKREVRRVRVKKKKKARGPSSQLLQVAELQQKRKVEEKKKKEKKSKSSGSKGVKELVRLLGGKKKKQRKDEDSPDPSGSDSSEYDESEEDSSSSDSQMLAPLQKKSLKQPGAVLKMLTRHARQTLDQTAVLEVGDSEEITGGVKMATYFSLLIRPYHPATSRDMKELHYLSICIDELRLGNWGH